MNFLKTVRFQAYKKQENQGVLNLDSLVLPDTASKKLPDFAKISSHHCVALFAAEGFSKLR